MTEFEHVSPSGQQAALKLDGLSDVEVASVLLDNVRTHTADIVRELTGQDLGLVDPDRSFRSLGLDSLGGVELHRRLTTSTGISVPVTVVFDYPSPAALTQHLVAARCGTDGAVAVVVPRPVVSTEPIAIVGMSCRYPGGVRSPEDLWQLVAEERDAISHFPDDRGWDLEAIYDSDPDSPGKTYVSQGGFLEDVAGFDAAFFGISPREAASMDPQQRLLLEASWEVLERAAIDPATLRGTRTGVFVGAEPQEYGPRLHQAPDGMEAYLLTGNTTSVMSGRIAFSLGLRGPALTVDTACSSSLVAIHLAAQALQRGECSLAIAGGVCVISSPGSFMAFSRLRGLSADGRCKPFSAAADGTGWSEGAGMIVLERLPDALRNGHQVLALIRGSAVNSDGASNGLTAPSGLAQQDVIRQALANADLGPDDVDTVEAHGTGTSLGDPIEAGAVIATYGLGRPAERPLWLGSVKSNIGHTQAAAGVAGVIKMVMAMRHGALPRSLHIDEPTPHVDWSSADVSLLTESVAWPDAGRVRRAGVSSFGISGTNAHLILEQAPSADDECAPPPVNRLLPWVISARSDAALADQGARLASFLDTRPGLRAVDVGYSLGTTRSALDRRAVILAREQEEFAGALMALAHGQETPGLIRGTVLPGSKMAYLFTGQGSQRLGMGQRLRDEFPVFADAFDEACVHLDRQLERHLRDVIFSDQLLLDETAYTQPALFAVETALYRLLESWGLRPDFLLGHSVGELVAAHVAGVLSLDDACALVAARGALMQELPRDGAMVAVQATEDEVATMLAERPDMVSMAAINGPASVVISGDDDAVLDIAAYWSARGRKTRRLRVSHAFHSPHMDEMLTEFRWVAEAMSYSAPSIPIVSNLTGVLATAEELCSPHYWVRHAREGVRFSDGIRWLESHGVRTFLELGPDGVLTAMAHECLADDGDQVFAAPLLRGDRDEPAVVIAAVAGAHVRGVPVDWAGLFGGLGARRVELPTYAFQRERFWLGGAGSGDAAGLGLVAAGHPLLGAAVELPGSGGVVLTGWLSAGGLGWLGDHVVRGRVVVPGTALLEMVVRAGDEVGCGRVAELVIEVPLALPPRDGVQVRVSVAEPDERGCREVVVFGRAGGGGSWVRHAAGVVGPAGPGAGAAELEVWPPAGAVPVEVAGLYDRLAEAGLEYGPVFRGLRAAWRRGEELFAEVGLPEGITVAGFAVHPALLDAALHVTGMPGDGGADGVTVPFAFADVVVHAAGASAARVRVSPAGGAGLSVLLADGAGDPVVSVGSLVLRDLPAAGEAEAGIAGVVRDGLLGMRWAAVPGLDSPGTERAGRWAVLGAGPELGFGDVARYPGLAALAAAVTAGEPVPDSVVVCPEAPRGAGPAEAARVVAAELLELVQGWLAADWLAGSRLVVLTSGAADAGAIGAASGAIDAGPGAVVELAGAAVWGLVRSAQAEHPGRLVLADVDELAGAGPLVMAGVEAGEPEFAVRGGQVHVPRLARVRPGDAAPSDVGGVVLVTGASGGLGRVVARHVAAVWGAGDLVLVSRRGAGAAGMGGLAAELAGLGTGVRVVACDVGDRAALAAVV
ncbi:MAG TPA: beta-ketoacyl synthase N-terminal-like domain-containing protein, partial [Streptosporangiaceae bacterium]